MISTANIVLFMTSTVDFGASYVYDLPQSMAIAFDEKLGYDDGKCLLFYSAYSFPNLFINLLGSWFINKFGFRKCLVGYSLLVVLGNGVFVLGAAQNSYITMIIGRIIQGTGAENLMITQYYTSHKFFKDTYLSLAMGLDMSFSYAASAISFYLAPWIYLTSGSLNLSLILSSIPTVISLCAAITLALKFNTDQKVNSAIEKINAEVRNETEKLKSSSEETAQLENPPEIVDNYDIEIQDIDHSKTKNFKFADLKKFPAVFWIICGIAFLDSTAYFAFIGVSTRLVSVKYKISYDDAKKVPLIVPFLQMLLIPVLTKIVYHKGGKPLYLVAGSVIGMFAFLVIILGPNLSPYIGVVLVGLFYTCHSSSFWPSAAIASEASHVDMGLGIVNTMQNLSNFLVPIILGSRFEKITEDNVDDYLKVLIFLLFIGFILSTALFLIDRSKGGQLYEPDETRKHRDESTSEPLK